MKIDVMKVVNIVDGTIKIDTIPTSWHRCVVSGEFRPPEEFRQTINDGIVSRSCICSAAEKLSKDDYFATWRRTAKITTSSEFISMTKIIDEEMELFVKSIPATELIKILQNLITLQGPTVRVCITQDGCYADSKFAQLSRSEIDLVGKDIDDSPVYSIGHSSQNA